VSADPPGGATPGTSREQPCALASALRGPFSAVTDSARIRQARACAAP
jgi:hypothetical protein